MGRRSSTGAGCVREKDGLGREPGRKKEGKGRHGRDGELGVEEKGAGAAGGWR